MFTRVGTERSTAVTAVLATLFAPAVALAQPLQWPLHDWIPPTQDYAAFNDGAPDQYHTGIDLWSSNPTVMAAAQGTVVAAIADGTYSNSNHCMGNAVIIEHPTLKIFTLYCHLDRIDVAKGQTVSAGTPIGVMGNTGSGPCGDFNAHLHFEVKHFGVLGNLHDDYGPEWGYVPYPHPNLWGYLDPEPYLTLDVERLSPIAIAASSDQDVLRSPMSADEPVTTVSAGQQFAAFAEYAGWYQVYLPSGNGPGSGWILGTPDTSAKLLRVDDPLNSHEGVNLRSCPDSACPVVSKVWHRQWLVQAGNTASGSGCAQDWHQIHIADNGASALGWGCGEFLGSWRTPLGQDGGIPVQPHPNDEVLMVPESTNDRIMLFDSFDGSLISDNFIDLATAGASTPLNAIQVGQEIWVSDQISDSIFRYSIDGTTHLGTITGGMDNIRGIEWVGDTVYVSNAGTANGAPGEAVVTVDVGTLTVNGFFAVGDDQSGDPFDVLDYVGALLVNDIDGEDIETHDMDGTWLSTFHDSDGVTGIDFPEQMTRTNHESVLIGGFSAPSGVYEFDVHGQMNYWDVGAQVRGVHELRNGQILFTTSDGVFVLHPGTGGVATIHFGVSARYIEQLVPPDRGHGVARARVDPCNGWGLGRGMADLHPTAFLRRWAVGRADLNSDGVTDAADLIQFVERRTDPCLPRPPESARAVVRGTVARGEDEESASTLWRDPP